jgi:AraC-like DNA-binding protein
MRQKPDEKFKISPALWKGLALVGLTPSAVLRQARLPASLHVRDKSAVDTAQFFELWKAIETLSGNPAIGLDLARRLDTAVLPPSSLVAFYARDYRDGLGRMARFKQLCAPERVHVVEGGGEAVVTIEWLHATETDPHSLIDAAFASFVELGRRGTETSIVPKRVDLVRPDVGGTAHKDYFGCAVRFAAEHNALVLDAKDLDRPFPGHNAELLDMLGPTLASALEEIQEDSPIGDQVKVLLKRALATGRPEFGDVARELGMSERTLQRRITDEGKNFRQLLTEARQDVVQRLLMDPAIEINEVAYLVGFEDSNSFYRAFRSWEGTTPSAWRQSRWGHG